MKYRVLKQQRAVEELQKWARSGAKKTLKKIFDMLQELETHPRTGTGHPEPLSQDRTGQWSRRIDKKNRLIYSIHDDIVEVHLISLMGHYTPN